MPRFDFQSPGAAFTDQITKALAERKAEERQHMLDQLTVNAEGRAAEEAKRRQAEHESSLATNALNRDVTTLSAYEAGGIQPGEDIEGRFGADGAKLFSRFGRTRPVPTPNVSSDITSFAGPEGTTVQGEIPQSAPAAGPTAPPRPPKMGYVGTPADQTLQRKRNMSAELLMNLLKDPKPENAMLAQLLERHMLANDGVAPDDFLEKNMPTSVPLGMFDQETGEITLGGKPATSAPSNAKFFTRSRTPVDPTPTPLGVDANGSVVFYDRTTRQPRTFEGIMKPTSRSGGNKNLDALGIPNAYLDDIDDKEYALGVDPANASPEALAGYRGAMGRAFSQAGIDASPVVRRLAIEYLSNPQSAEQKASSMLKTEKDFNDLMTMLNAINPAAKQILIEAAKPKPPEQNMADKIKNWFGR
jgi:hypothetical protein